MPVVTSSDRMAFKSARRFPPVDRCDNVKGFTNEDYSEGLNSYRDIETETYKYIIPQEVDGLAPFSSKVRPKVFEDRLSVDEVDLIIRNKFLNERYSIQELFKTSDEHNKGFITKQALMKIIFSICGNLKVDTFYKLLERYKLNKKAVVTFSDVEKAFGPSPSSKFRAPIIFHGMGHLYNVSAAFALHLLKEAALDQEFDLKAILPKICSEEGGLVLMHQFRDALKRIKISLCDEDFNRLWIKLDEKGVGSIPYTKLLYLLNLQDDGTPMCGIRPTFIPLKRPKIERLVKSKPPLKYINCYELNKQSTGQDLRAGGVSFPLIKVHGWKPKGPGGLDECEFGKGLQFIQGLQLLRENRPKFNSVFDILSYIFEEPYQGLLVVFKRFDPKGAGMVDVETGLKILSECGLKLEIDNLVKFLSNMYCLDPNSGMNYKKLLDSIQTKGCGVRTTIAQIIAAQSQSSGLKSLRTMSADEIKEELFKILHKDFMTFQSQLESSSQNSNWIYELEAKRIIEGIIGSQMTKEQWKELQGQFDYKDPLSDDEEQNVNRLINFRTFLRKFDNPTGICRYRHKPDSDKFTRTAGVRRVITENFYDPPRDYANLCRLIADKLKKKFHSIDKIYKSFEFKLQGSLTKDMLLELLNSQGCKLTNYEMDFIWKLVEAEPNHTNWTYRQILKYLILNLYKQAQEICVEQRRSKLKDAPGPDLGIIRDFRVQKKSEKLKEKDSKENRIDVAMKVKTFIVDEEKTKQTIQNMTPLIRSLWMSIKKQIREIDVVGNTTVELFEMKDLLIKNGFNIPPDEMENLLYSFDLKRNGRFHYLVFLDEFAKGYFSEFKNRTTLHFDRVFHQILNQKTNEKLTVTETYVLMRNSLLRQWRSLIRAFRKLDTHKIGKLDITQLNQLLLSTGIHLSKDDLYHVFSGFDKNLDGKIDYGEFVDQLLDVFTPYMK